MASSHRGKDEYCSDGETEDNSAPRRSSSRPERTSDRTAVTGLPGLRGIQTGELLSHHGISCSWQWNDYGHLLVSTKGQNSRQNGCEKLVCCHRRPLALPRLLPYQLR